MATLIDGKLISAKIKEDIKAKIEELKAKNITPGLAVILVGEDPASTVYVRNKEKMCGELGIKSEVYRLPESTTTSELLDLIDKLNENKAIHGILLQHPVPSHIDEYAAFNRISPKKDVDGFTDVNIGKLVIGKDTFVSCTPNGILAMLKHENVDISGKHCVIVGRSNIVGKPMSSLMLKENATVTICHSKTTNLTEITKQADILIVAIGKPKFITKDMVKKDAVVIDVGINRIDGKLIGDVDFDNVKEVASKITPVPGGVGPMTMVMLMSNTIKASTL
ncbi:MAG: bifunctional methylenetetrahydrofolate dehydrogenase/methenyltetrahydrofolate cyclohydrolase FolD [Clostridia bacterium]|nr:bifunctional methylenetetrahydrofolate dehydrogenase/methenyltetrahydrofolate cyclohydrolase FolD [Clostridia bacterium]